MQLTVFEASGGVSTHVVALAAQRGHQVRAIYRTTPQPPPLSGPRFSSTGMRCAPSS